MAGMHKQEHAKRNHTYQIPPIIARASAIVLKFAARAVLHHSTSLARGLNQ